MKRPDAVLVGLLVALAAAALGLDRFAERGLVEAVRPRGEVISRSLYCPSPEGTEAVMATTNLGRRAVTLRRLAVGGSTETAAAPAVLAGARRNTVVVSQLGIAQAAGVAETFGGDTVTDLQIFAKDRGITASKCSGRPGGRWLFASASTTRRQDHFLLVVNPFEEEAVVRVRVIAPDKDFVPVLLRDRVIPPLSQEPLLLADFIAETPSFGLDVEVTQGRVVVSRYAQIATREGLRGISVDIGAPEPSNSWFFAGGEVPGDGEETIVLVNPGTAEALVEVAFQTDSQTVAPEALEEVAVPAGRQVSVKVSDFLPRGARHSTRLISTNEVPIVAERTTVAAVPGGRGYESTLGVPRASRRWAVSAGGLPEANEYLSIVGSGRSVVPVKITLVSDKGSSSPALGLRAFPDRRTNVDLEPLLAGGAATVLVEAPGDIAVEAHLMAGGPYSDLGSSAGQPLD